MDLMIEHKATSFTLVSTVCVCKFFKPFHCEKSRPEPRRGTMIYHDLGALPSRCPPLFLTAWRAHPRSNHQRPIYVYCAELNWRSSGSLETLKL